jgi:hypothetical protein
MHIILFYNITAVSKSWFHILKVCLKEIFAIWVHYVGNHNLLLSRYNAYNIVLQYYSCQQKLVSYPEGLSERNLCYMGALCWEPQPPLV